MTTPKIRNLIRQANKVAQAGKRSAAVDLYRQVLAEDENQYEAWLGLGHILTDETERTEAYTKALAINPAGEEAQHALAVLRGEVTETALVELKAAEKETVESDTDDDIKQLKDEEAAESSIYPYPVDISQWTKPDGTMVCYGNHNRETTLRCNRCGRPICQKHFKRTSVGYRCLACIREIEDEYFTAETKDYIIATVVAIPLSFIAGGLIGLVGGFGGIFLLFFMFAIGGAGGSLVGRLVSQSIGRRRGRYLPYLVATIVAIGGFLPALIFGAFFAGLIYAFAATSAAYYQLR